VRSHSEAKSSLEGMRNTHSEMQKELQNLVSTNKIKLKDLEKVNGLYSDINSN